MDIAKEIKKLMLDEDINMITLANKLNTSQPNLSKKLKKNDLRISDLESIIDVMGYDLEINFKKREE